MAKHKLGRAAIWLSVTAALGVVVSACGPVAPSPTARPSTSPARAEDTQGQFRLVFDLPRADWRVDEEITGTATLSLVGADAVEYGASGSGPIAFSFDEVGGSRRENAGMTFDCVRHRMDPGQAVSSPIKKSGGYSDAAEPSDFNRWFMTDPLVHLPAGDWRITAIGVLSSWPCSEAGAVNLSAALVIHVAD